jgi:hypothetical protein
VFFLATNFYYLENAVRDFPGKLSSDKITLYEKRFGELKKELARKRVVGYFSEDPPDSREYLRNYYLTQYALSPVIVLPELNRDLVVGNFSKLAAPPQVVKQKDLYLLRDYGNGVFLYRGREE